MGCCHSVSPEEDRRKAAPPTSTTAAERRRRLSMMGTGPGVTGAAGGGGGAGPGGPGPGLSRDESRRRRLSIAATPKTHYLDVKESNSKVEGLGGVAHVTIEAGPATGTKAVELPIKFGCYSRPGNDPMKRIKENQDSMLVVDCYGGKNDHMFFGVWDGHGPNGAHVSQFVRDNLPASFLVPALDEVPDDGGKGGVYGALRDGCLKTNTDLLRSAIDVYVSGSTSVVAFIHNRHLICANVGDSRAVLGREKDGAVRALDLSNDQKPDRPDEMARILKCGGRVFAWGVPRVWLRDENLPGLAMSRSFGDTAAESVGVFAEPELSSTNLGPADKFIILASDGVWEFISSQEAVDIVTPFLSKSPQEACDALVKESVKRWNEEEDVVDDTTCIVAFLNYEAEL